jgi:16S rRNA C967 or C1407 C5-methylase (RsmB/RsmF family)
MTKTSRDPASASEAAFHKHYAAIWGEERWQSSLFPALAAPTRQVALLNSYAASASFEDLVTKAGLSDQLEQITFPQATDSKPMVCHAVKTATGLEDGERISSRIIPQADNSSAGISGSTALSHWNMDAASVLAAIMLDVRPGEDVLDLCAAPGGKSIVLAQSMWPHILDNGNPTKPAKVGRLVSNEANKPRHRRLTENLKAYLPSGLFQSKHISSLNVDATNAMAVRQLLSGLDSYDKVLVDAPCSSERHIIHANLAAKASNRAAPEMTNWRPGSSSKLAKTQLELLMTALRCTRVAGSVLYATCSIEPTENDGVVGKVLAIVEKEVKKGRNWTFKVGFDGEIAQSLETLLENQWAERTKYGWIVLPDHPAGGRWGPLFFARLTKVAAAKS